MKLVLFCPHFRPDLHAATGEVMTRLVESLAERGHRIDVVTSLPWYRAHDVEPDWRGRPWRTERTEWGRIVRVWPFPTDKTNVRARAAGFAGMTSLAVGLGLTLGRPDVVMGMSPPVFFGDAAWTVARRWRVPFVFNTQDIFPDIAIDLGALSGSRVVAAARRYELSMYRRADAVTVLSSDQAANVGDKLLAAADEAGSGGLRARSADPGKVTIIRNFVDLDRIRPVDIDGNRYRLRHRLADRTVVMYSGNVGLSQPFELIRAAAENRVGGDTVFVINGEGAARPDVDRWAGSMDNVLTVDFGPRNEISTILGAADLHLVLLRPGLARSSTPSKLYGIMAAGRPVLAGIDEGTEVANVIKESGMGRSVAPDDPWVFCRALAEMLADRVELADMGRRGRSYASAMLTPDRQAEAYEQLFADLVARRS